MYENSYYHKTIHRGLDSYRAHIVNSKAKIKHPKKYKLRNSYILFVCNHKVLAMNNSSPARLASREGVILT